MQPITFAINVSNNTLNYVTLLLRSLKENLDDKNHQILIFVDSDNEGMTDYLLSIKDTFVDCSIITHTNGIPVGYARNTNLLVEYAKHDIVSYLQSDMVIGPHYDTEILKHVKTGRILSATRVEPPLHGPSSLTITKDFGVQPTSFNMEEWNTFSTSVKRDELISHFFAPITFYKGDWLALGGYDTVFRRSREDSDLVQRCLHTGIELVQTFSANVYHFTCVSSRGVNWFDSTDTAASSRVQLQNRADQIELLRFIRKWGTFNHGTSALFKLDADLVIRNVTDINLIANLEPFFSRVWVESVQLQDILTTRSLTSHNLANELLGISDTDWEARKHLVRLEDLSDVYHVGTPDEYFIAVTIDGRKLASGDGFITNIQHMYDMLKDCDAGEYELDNVSVSIREVISPSPDIVAQNPKFDYTLLTTH